MKEVIDMSQDVKISVIMPVYKVEQYVGKAIESIQSQSFRDFEFIIVDDGTPDDSGKICDTYAEQDGRIIVIHKNNGGAPSARNMAIERAKGKYLYFMDSDDWAEPDMLEDMFLLAEKNSAQLVVTGYYIDTYYTKDAFITQELAAQDAVYGQQEFRENAYKLFDTNLLYTPWNKLYLADYIRSKNLKFPNTLWDDFPFNLSVIRDISCVCVSSRKYYHFVRARADSETAKYVPSMYKKREEEQDWLLELYKYWDIQNYASKEFLSRRYIERVIGCIENVTNPRCPLSSTERKAALKQMLNNQRIEEALKTARPKSLMMRCMLVPLKIKCMALICFQSSVISKVKTKNAKLFAVLKARR